MEDNKEKKEVRREIDEGVKGFGKKVRKRKKIKTGLKRLAIPHVAPNIVYKVGLFAFSGMGYDRGRAGTLHWPGPLQR